MIEVSVVIPVAGNCVTSWNLKTKATHSVCGLPLTSSCSVDPDTHTGTGFVAILKPL